MIARRKLRGLDGETLSLMMALQQSLCENSAHNILMRFFARLGPHTERCGVLHTTNLEVVSTELAPIGQVQQLELW